MLKRNVSFTVITHNVWPLRTHHNDVNSVILLCQKSYFFSIITACAETSMTFYKKFWQHYMQSEVKLVDVTFDDSPSPMSLCDSSR